MAFAYNNRSRRRATIAAKAAPAVQDDRRRIFATLGRSARLAAPAAIIFAVSPLPVLFALATLMALVGTTRT